MWTSWIGRHRIDLLSTWTIALLLCTLGEANAAVTTVSSNNAAAWQLSSTVDVFDASPWPGASLPAGSSFTLPAVGGNSAAGLGILSGSGVTYYRTAFLLPAFGSITADVSALADNNIQIFVNGHELALYGTDLSGFSRSPFHLFIDTSGAVINGYLGGSSFSQISSPFAAADWNSGTTNEIELAIRNLSGGDSGGFVFNATLTTTAAVVPVPEPESYAMLLAGLGLLGFVVRRRK